MSSFNTQYSALVDPYASQLNVANTTITANAAQSCGAVYASQLTAVTLTGVAISRNVATSGAGGGVCSRAETALALCSTGQTVTMLDQARSSHARLRFFKFSSR